MKAEAGMYRTLSSVSSPEGVLPGAEVPEVPDSELPDGELPEGPGVDWLADPEGTIDANLLREDQDPAPAAKEAAS